MTEPTPLTRRARAGPLLLTLGFVGAVFYPTLAGKADSFPLSTYPMFAHPRGTPEIVQLVAVTDTQDTVVVPPLLLGTDEVLQAKVILGAVARKGKKARLKFCHSVAERIARSATYTSWQRLELLRVRFDPIEYLTQGRKPISEKRLIQCPITRRDSRVEGSARPATQLATSTP